MAALMPGTALTLKNIPVAVYNRLNLVMPSEPIARARTLRAALPAGKFHARDTEKSKRKDRPKDRDHCAYNREFIALAMKLDTKLVTLDEKLLRAFPKRAIALHAG